MMSIVFYFLFVFICFFLYSFLFLFISVFFLYREDLDIACQREVFEETGIKTEFKGILSFRHVHKGMFGKSDLFFICLMKPLTSTIVLDDEIAACEWVDMDIYTKQIGDKYFSLLEYFYVFVYTNFVFFM